MLDTITENAKTLAVAAGLSVLVGLVVYGISASEIGELKGRVGDLRAELDGLRTTQANTDQRLGDGDAQQKALALRLDELAGRLDAAEKAVAAAQPVVAAPAAEPVAPAPVAEPAPAAPVAPVAGAPTAITPPVHH